MDCKKVFWWTLHWLGKLSPSQLVFFSEFSWFKGFWELHMLVSPRLSLRAQGAMLSQHSWDFSHIHPTSANSQSSLSPLCVCLLHTHFSYPKDELLCSRRNSLLVRSEEWWPLLLTRWEWKRKNKFWRLSGICFHSSPGKKIPEFWFNIAVLHWTRLLFCIFKHKIETVGNCVTQHLQWTQTVIPKITGPRPHSPLGLRCSLIRRHFCSWWEILHGVSSRTPCTIFPAFKLWQEVRFYATIMRLGWLNMDCLQLCRHFDQCREFSLTWDLRLQLFCITFSINQIKIRKVHV